jgi:hypothetical protein
VRFDLEARWFGLVAALSLHVADEALTGFLDFYNPLVRSIRSTIPWFPMPTFTFGVWLTGLAALVVALGVLGPAIGRGAAGTRPVAWLLSGIMFLNGLGHLIGSWCFMQWLPGTTTAPLLLVASAWLAHGVSQRTSGASPHERE